jgi:hypothetical protein
MVRHAQGINSAAISVVPEPPNGSSTMSHGSLLLRIAFG